MARGDVGVVMKNCVEFSLSGFGLTFPVVVQELERQLLEAIRSSEIADLSEAYYVRGERVFVHRSLGEAVSGYLTNRK
jgi:hypothetical protein